MFIVGIAGGSGSGKTTFAQKVLKRLESSEVTLLHQDSYYHSVPLERLKVNGKGNFDHPEAFDWELLKDHLTRLKAGEGVDSPTYDFGRNRRSDRTERLGPCRALLVEGIFTLWEPAIRNLFDIKVFLHVDADIRFIRRLHRDVRERGRTLDSIIQQYYDTVRPMHHEFLDPTRQFADVVVGEETDIAADLLSARIGQIVDNAAVSEFQKHEEESPV